MFSRDPLWFYSGCFKVLFLERLLINIHGLRRSDVSLWIGLAWFADEGATYEIAAALGSEVVDSRQESLECPYRPHEKQTRVFNGYTSMVAVKIPVAEPPASGGLSIGMRGLLEDRSSVASSGTLESIVERKGLASLDSD
ncbi:hypothetical protein V6N13_012985 [Hibiscus sabdariffa]